MTKSRRPRRRRARRGPGSRWGVRLGLLALIFVGGWLSGRWMTTPRPLTTGGPAPSTPGLVEAGPSRSPAPPQAVPSKPQQAPTIGSLVGGRLALVIDDLGRSVEDVDRLSSLGIPVTFAVLPFETRTAEVVAALTGRRAEILCHLPMDPAGDANPGPGALASGMGDSELRARTREALQRVPGAVGVNNHMGSALTADPAAMKAILEEIDDRDLFFLDSRTSAASVGFTLARQLGLPAAERRVFLDTDPAPDAIREQARRWFELAHEQGQAIAIAHPYDTTFEVLPDLIDAARAQGLEFVGVSTLMTRSAPAG